MKKIYLIAVVIALAAGVATYFFASELKASKIVTGVDEASVLIALEDIEENTILTEEMFQVVKLPVTAVSYSSISNPKDIIGYMASVKILKGEQLMLGKIVPVGKESDKGRLSFQLDEGMYAYSVCVNIENSVSYFIKENDKVNIYDARTQAAEPLLENVRVIRISDYVSNIQEDTGVEITSFQVFTLELNKEQISKMMTVDTPASDPGKGDEGFRAVLVSHIEAYGLSEDIKNADVPENQVPEPHTNFGMGEIAPPPPTTSSN